MNGDGLRPSNSTMKTFYLFVILMYVSLTSSTAQVRIDQGNITIKENSIISIKGAVTNTATITNQGTLLLASGWNNRGQYTAGQGTIILNGGQAQTFDHHGQAVSTLAITQGSQVYFPSNIFITSNLVLDEGIITSGSKTSFVLKENTAITGGSSNSFINGALYHTGLGEKFYPVGKDGIYAPVTLRNVKGDNPVVGMEFYTNQSITNHGEEIQLLSNNIWKQTLLSGTYTGSEVELSTSMSQKLQPDQAQLVVTGSNEKNGLFQNFGQASIQISGNTYTIASYLPVTHTYLTVGLLLIDTRKLYIPNTFSLQASNPEDQTIKVYGNQLANEDFYMIIQDTWGNIVFETKSLTFASTQGWNGTNIRSGYTEHSNIFRYLVRGRFTSGESFKRTGTIILY